MIFKSIIGKLLNPCTWNFHEYVLATVAWERGIVFSKLDMDMGNANSMINRICRKCGKAQMKLKRDKVFIGD